MERSEISESSSEFSESCSEPERYGGRLMSSVAIAQNHTKALADMLAAGSGWKAQVTAVYAGLTDRRFARRLEKLTWNRVKSWLYGEARTVDHLEIMALQELRAIEEARRERLKLAATASRLAALLAAEGAPLDGRQMRALGRLAGALDRAGVEAGGV